MEARRASQPSYPFQLSLRVRHPSIDPASISQELQIEAEHSFRAGEPRETTRSAAGTPVHVDSYWLATLDLSALLLGTPETALVAGHTQAIAFSALDTALTIVVSSVLRLHAVKELRMPAQHAADDDCQYSVERGESDGVRVPRYERCLRRPEQQRREIERRQPVAVRVH